VDELCESKRVHSGVAVVLTLCLQCMGSLVRSEKEEACCWFSHFCSHSCCCCCCSQEQATQPIRETILESQASILCMLSVCCSSD